MILSDEFVQVMGLGDIVVIAIDARDLALCRCHDPICPGGVEIFA